MDSVLAFIDSIDAFLAGLGDSLSDLILPIGTMVSRIVLPILAVLVVVRCGLSLIRSKSEPETWAWLGLDPKTIRKWWETK